MWFCSLLNGAIILGDHVCLTWMMGIFIFRTEWYLEGALLGEQPIYFDLWPSILESSSIIIALPTPVVEENNPTVMTLLAHDWEEIDGKNANSTSQKQIKLEHTNDTKWMRFYNRWDVALG